MVFDWGYFKIYETTDLIGYLRGINLVQVGQPFLGGWPLLSSWGMFILRQVFHFNGPG